MTPTPEVSERARALREAVEAQRFVPVSLTASKGEIADVVLSAIVKKLGITQEMVDSAADPCDCQKCADLNRDTALVLATLLAAGADDGES